MRLRLAAALVLVVLSVPCFAAVTGTVMTTDGAPFAGAKLTLLPFEPSDARARRLLAGAPGPEALANATSDSKGNFSLEAAAATVADLRIEATGMEPQTIRVEKDDELGAIALRKAASKEGRVTANGKAVANARVIWWDSAGRVLSQATTDGEGRYVAPDPRNAMAVTVLHPEHAVSEEVFPRRGENMAKAVDRTLVPGKAISGRVVAADGQTPVAKATIVVDGWPLATSAEDGTFTVPHAPVKWKSVVALSDGLQATRRFTAEAPLTLRLGKAPLLRGVVRDGRTQQPLANVEVRVTSQENNLGTSTVTDAKGNYSRADLPPGAYRLAFQHPAYTLELTEAGVGNAAVTKDARLTPQARISGTVVDEEKRGVAGASLAAEEVFNEGMPRMFRMPSTSFSGPDGRFVIRVSGDQELKVRATKKGFPETKSEAIRLASAERKRGVTIVIPSGVAVTGRVTDRDGNPLSGVAVIASESENTNGGPMRRMIVLNSSSDDDQTVRTGTDGSFTTRLREGTYDFSFRREGYAPKALRAHAVTIGARPVETSLDPSVEIRGRVVRNGAGIEGVSVSSFTPDQQSNTITAADGSFTLADLAAGPTRVSLRKEEELILEQRNLTAPARDVVIDLPLGGKVSGRVVDKSSGKPVTAFQAGISASRNSGSMMMMMPPLQRSFTSDDGTFTLENVPPGAVNLVVNAPGYATGRKGGLTLEEGKALSDVEIELEPGVKLVGRVTAPDGAPLAGAQVRSTPSGNVRMVMAMPNDARATTDAAGEYVLEGLEPGEKAFEFTHSKYVTSRKTIDLKGSETRLDVRLEGGMRVTGTVTGDTGAAVPDATVEAYSTGFGRSAKTDANGSFTFDTLQAGRYTFRASKAGYAPGKVEDVDIQAGAPVRISLGRGGVIYGHITGLPDSDYANVTVEAGGSAGQASASVDSSGNYRIEGAPSGNVRVSAMLATRDYSSRKTSTAKTVQMEAGGSQQVDLEFRTDVVIRGRITRDGRPLSAATVSFMPRRGAQTVVTTPADEQGLYSASGLEDGEYSVSVMDTQRITPYQTTYQVHGSATFDIDYRTTTVRGRVVDASTGDPVSDAAVQLRPSVREGMFSARTAITDSTGAFAIDFVQAGTFVATVEKEGYGNEARTISISESSAPDLDFRISRNDGILLTVVDARDNRPLAAQARVVDGTGQVVYEPGFRMSGATDPIRLPLGIGTFTVTVSASGYADQTLTMTSPSRQTVRLSRGGTILVRSRASAPRRIRIRDASGAPYNYLRARDSFFLEPSPATLTLPNVVAGTYTLQILGDHDVVLDQTQVTVVDDQTVTVDL